MKATEYKKGIIYSIAGSLWWGVLGTIFFKYITYMGAFEVTLHRLIWTCFILFATTIIFKKINVFKDKFKRQKKDFNN